MKFFEKFLGKQKEAPEQSERMKRRIKEIQERPMEKREIINTESMARAQNEGEADLERRVEFLKKWTPHVRTVARNVEEMIQKGGISSGDLTQEDRYALGLLDEARRLGIEK